MDPLEDEKLYANQIGLPNNDYNFRAEKYPEELEKHEGETNRESEDVYSQLRQKEKDLILAAELGTLLLEEKEELMKFNEELQREFTEKIEAVEQEKHRLRRRLEVSESDHESKVTDLQTEIFSLQTELDNQKARLTLSEKERYQVVEELSEQNHRLTEQLQKAAGTEEELTQQVQSLRVKVTSRNQSAHSSSHLVAQLKEEVRLLTERRNYLERKIGDVINERDVLVCSLEESSDRVHALERKLLETEDLSQERGMEISELQRANSRMQQHMEDLNLQLSVSHQDPRLNNSLFSEMNASVAMDTYDKVDDEAVEMDPPMATEMNSAKLYEQENRELQQQLSMIEDQLRALLEGLCQHLTKSTDLKASKSSSHKRRSRSQSSTSEQRSHTGAIDLIKDIRHLVEEKLKTNQNKINRVQCNFDHNCQELEVKKGQLVLELDESYRKIEKLTRELTAKEENLINKNEEVLATNQQLKKFREECENLKEKHRHRHRKEDDIRKIREERDEAVVLREISDMELTKAKMDIINLDNQLQQAIRQKVELAQQLDSWQVDMHSMIENRVKNQLYKQESQRRNSSIVLPRDNKGNRFQFWRS